MKTYDSQGIDALEPPKIDLSLIKDKSSHMTESSRSDSRYANSDIQKTLSLVQLVRIQPLVEYIDFGEIDTGKISIRTFSIQNDLNQFVSIQFKQTKFLTLDPENAQIPPFSSFEFSIQAYSHYPREIMKHLKYCINQQHVESIQISAVFSLPESTIRKINSKSSTGIRKFK